MQVIVVVTSITEVPGKKWVLPLS